MLRSTTVLIILSQLIVEIYLFIDQCLHEIYELCIQIKFRNLLKDKFMIREKMQHLLVCVRYMIRYSEKIQNYL